MKVGDRVRIKDPATYSPFKSGELTGTIVVIDTDGDVGVEVDDGADKGHDFNGNPLSNGNGWWFGAEEVEAE